MIDKKEDSLRGRLLAVSDIHGYEEGLLALLHLANYNSEVDRLLLLGDYIDADKPSTWPTLAFVHLLAKNGARVLVGNHELKFASLSKGGRVKYRRWVKWVRKLPLYIIEENYLFVHAGLRPGIPLAAQSVRDLTEIREAFYTCSADAWSRPLAAETGEPGRGIVFGHTATYKLGAQPGELWSDGFRIGIDTGAKQGMRLTLVDFTGKLAYSCATGPGYDYGDLRIENIARLLPSPPQDAQEPRH